MLGIVYRSEFYKVRSDEKAALSKDCIDFPEPIRPVGAVLIHRARIGFTMVTGLHWIHD